MVELLVKHTHVKVTARHQRTPLMLAAAAGHARRVNWMLTNVEGIDLEQTDSDLETVQVHAMRSRSAETISFVLAHGAKVDPTARHTAGCTLLHYAARYGADTVIARLFEAVADINARTSTNATALMLAAGGGRLSTLALLVGHVKLHGIREPNPATDQHGWRPVHFAASLGQTQALEFLLTHFGRKHTKEPGADAPLVDVGLGHWTDAMEGEDPEEVLGYTSLMLACKEGHKDTIEFLLKRVCVAGARDDDDPFDPLANSIVEAWPLLHWCCEHGYTEAVRVLLGPVGASHGVNEYIERLSLPMHGADGGTTALMVAARAGSSLTSASLVQAEGVDPNLQDDQGRTALMLLASDPTRHRMMYAIHRLDTVDLSIRDNNGDTALVRALDSQQWPEVMPQLHDVQTLANRYQEHDMDVTAVYSRGRTILHVAAAANAASFMSYLLDASHHDPPLDVNARDDDGATPLMRALEAGASDAVNMVMDDERVDSEACDNRGRTALMYAVDHSPGRTPVDKAVLSTVVGELYPNHMDDEDSTGHTPFTLACKNGYRDAVEQLVRLHEVNTYRVAEGRMGLEWACAGGHAELAIFLAGHWNVMELPAPASDDEARRRMEDLAACVAGHLRNKTGDLQEALAVVNAAATASANHTDAPSTVEHMLALPGLPADFDETKATALLAMIKTLSAKLGLQGGFLGVRLACSRVNRGCNQQRQSRIYLEIALFNCANQQ